MFETIVELKAFEEMCKIEIPEKLINVDKDRPAIALLPILDMLLLWL